MFGLEIICTKETVEHHTLSQNVAHSLTIFALYREDAAFGIGEEGLGGEQGWGRDIQTDALQIGMDGKHDFWGLKFQVNVNS